MRKKYYLINWLESPRYSTVTPNNVAKVNRYSFVFASSFSTEQAMTFSYTELIEKLRKHFGVASDDGEVLPSATQQFRNHMSALNGFLACCGKTPDAKIGIELGSEFDKQLREYLNAIEVAARTKSDRSSQLNKIRCIYQDLLAEKNSSGPKTTSFNLAIRHAVAQSGLAPKTLAKQTGISPATLRRWLNGATLNKRGFPSLRRLEAGLNLERNALVSLVKEATGQALQKVSIPSYRRRIAERPSVSFALSETALEKSFIEEWRQLFKYKVGGMSALKQSYKGTWRLIPKHTVQSSSQLATRSNMACPTADMFLKYFRNFLGVLTSLPEQDGGIPWEVPPRQTLAWCMHPRALSLYIDWLTERSEGIRHNGQKTFAQTMASLVRPETGYLWQQPGIFRDRLPEAFRPQSDEAWRKMCEESHIYLRRIIRSCTGISRSPEEPIAKLLESTSPLKPILEAIDRMDIAASQCLPGSIMEACHKRNALLLALLLSNPLRQRTIASLTWISDGLGSLRGSPAKGWRISLTPEQLKNGNSKHGKRYDVKVADWVKPRLDAYIEEYRNTLLRDKESRYLFVGDKKGEIWKGVGATVRELSLKYIPGCPGFGTHSIRHLVATDWLRRYPGDYLTVAELLTDKIETVLANYAHLKRDDSFSRYEAHIAKLR